MASIVKWQAFKMQEYRFRLMIGISSFLELFGVGQLARSPLAAATAGGGMMPTLRFFSNTTQTISIRPSDTDRPSSWASQPILLERPAPNGTPATRSQGGAANDYDHLPPQIMRHRIILPVNTINLGTLTGLRYARSLSSDVTAVHVSMDRAETEQLQRDWPSRGDGVRLVVLDSPHNMVLEPLLQYIQSIMALKQAKEVITVVVPQSIHPRWWSNLARTQMAVLLRLALPFQTGIVITDVPYALDGEGIASRFPYGRALEPPRRSGGVILYSDGAQNEPESPSLSWLQIGCRSAEKLWREWADWTTIDTASVFINDDKSGLHIDYEAWLEKIAPHEPVSQDRHDDTGEDNAHAHIKRRMMGREVVVAVTEGKLDFGNW